MSGDCARSLVSAEVDVDVLVLELVSVEVDVVYSSSIRGELMSSARARASIRRS
jgi:hypothetical protein